MKKQDIIITTIFILAIIFSKGDFAFSFLFLIYLSTFIYRYFSKKSKDSLFFKNLKTLCKLGYTILLVAFIGFESILLKDIAINKDNFPKRSHVIVLGGKLEDNIPSKTLELMNTMKNFQIQFLSYLGEKVTMKIYQKLKVWQII